jgi:dTDP-4-dehydrorhamnose 3,5-epimerase-like enzyme
MFHTNTDQILQASEGVKHLAIGACALFQNTIFADARGNLAVTEHDKHLPFLPKRVFWVYDVPLKGIRGGHAHKLHEEYLVCIRGSIKVALDDGLHTDEIDLNHPSLGLYISARVWASQFNHSPDAILLVLASGIYDRKDYIENYAEFLSMIKNSK